MKFPSQDLGVMHWLGGWLRIGGGWGRADLLAGTVFVVFGPVYLVRASEGPASFGSLIGLGCPLSVTAWSSSWRSCRALTPQIGG